MLEECPCEQLAEHTSAAIMRYALVNNATTVLEEKRKSAIPQKTSKTQNGVSSNGMIGLHLEILTKMKNFLSYNCNSKRKIIGYFMELFVIEI